MNEETADPAQRTLTIEQAIDLAVELQNSGRLPESESIYQQILQLEPNQPIAQHLLGVIAHKVGKNDIAVELIGKALAIKPDYAEAHYNLGLALQELAKMDDAVASYHRALALKPDFAEAHYNLGNVLNEQGKMDDAVAGYDKALALKPDFAEAHSNLGNVLKQQGKMDDAEASYHKALALKPDFAEAHSNLGNVLKEQGKMDDAVARYDKALAIKPDYAEAHYNLGLVFQELRKMDGAIASYHEALAIKPDYAEAYSNLGIVLKEQGKMDDAVASYHKALTIKPDFAGAHSNLGTVLKEQGKMDDAVASYDKALALKPDFAEAHSNLGLVFQEQGKMDEAVASYHRALALKPDYAEAHCNLGNVLKQQEKMDEAVASYHRALALKPDFAEAHSNLGTVHKEQGKMDDAAASYHRALAIKPDFAEAHSNLGLVFYEQGKMDEAVASYHKALTIKPDFTEAWNNLKFSAKGMQFLGSAEDVNTQAGAAGLSATSRADFRFVLHKFYLDGFRPHEAEEGFIKVITALPALRDVANPLSEKGNQPAAIAQLSDNIIALLHFGRSGTGLLHSLIDSHPEITSLPGVYLRGYFNQGIWEKLSANGWRELPERFADEFAVLFDARTSKPIPSRLGEQPFSIGTEEGMTSVGENRNEFLSLDRGMFCRAALRLMAGMESVDPTSFLMVVHAAFEEVNKSTVEQSARKRLCFYHIHNPDDYAMPNFLRFAPNARLLMTVREPIQNCESWLHLCLDNHSKSVGRILGLLFGFDHVPFRLRPSIGVRLEDLKARPEATMKALCAWLGVEVTPSLYEMTAQGKKWWGDPTSPDYGQGEAMSPFDETTTKRPVGTILSAKDRFILRTLFYPFSLRFGYRQPDPVGFARDLKEIPPLLDDMLDFEKRLVERSNMDPEQFRRSGSYLLLRAGLMDRWNVLEEVGDYPHMITPLAVK